MKVSSFDMYGTASVFIGLGKGALTKAATYQMIEGVKQGDMEVMPNLCRGINQAN